MIILKAKSKETYRVDVLLYDGERQSFQDVIEVNEIRNKYPIFEHRKEYNITTKNKKIYSVKFDEVKAIMWDVE